MAKKKVTKKRVVKDPDDTEREEEYEEEEEEEEEPTVRMKAPLGHGASGIPVGDQVVQIKPDKKGFVDAPRKCAGALIGLGYSYVREDDDEG